jgi:hypothetical protein
MLIFVPKPIGRRDCIEAPRWPSGLGSRHYDAMRSIDAGSLYQTKDAGA